MNRLIPSRTANRCPSRVRTDWLTLATVVFGCLTGVLDSPAADPNLTVDQIFGIREFESETLPVLRWSERGSEYYTLVPSTSSKGADLVRVDPATGERVVIVPASAFVPEKAKVPLKVEAFTFSKDETRLLLYTNSKKVWRQNTRGDYWLLDVRTRVLHRLGGDAEPATMMFAKLSPDGTRVAFVRENNLYVQDLKDFRVSALTTDGSKSIINGTGDWVNEEELGLRDCFRWNPDGTQIVFWQFNTTGVSEFHLVNTVVADTPRITTFAYPKVGGTNSATRLGVISANGGAVRWLDLPGDPREHYLPQAEWTPDGTGVLVQQFNRAQTVLHLWLADPKTGSARKVMTESDPAWLENENPVRWLDDGKSVLWLSERTGWRHAYRVGLDGTPAVPITHGDYDVIAVEAVDSVGGWLYFAASPDDPIRRSMYRVRLEGGEPERLSPRDQPGWHTYDVSPAAKWAIHTHSTFTTPPVVDLVRLADHTSVRTLIDNRKLREKLAALESPKVEFIHVDIAAGGKLDGWCIKPAHVDPAARLPLLIYVYGEPHGQTVRDAWPGDRGLWHWMLAQQGFVVASVDNRGINAPRGRAWRKSVHKKIGIAAPEDQARAVRALIARWPFVDSSRIGSWGWSGGGSMSLHAIFRFPDLYRTAISVAPVADQRLYDTIYQERYMGLPADNPAGYREGSPITHAHKLRGNLLLVHGTGDDNCHYQGTERLIDMLVEKGKRFQVLPYPNRSHSVNEGEHTTRHLYAVMTRYLHDNLRSPHAPAPAPAYLTKNIRGWNVNISQELVDAEPKRLARALELLDTQLEEIARVVPGPVVAKLRDVPLYFNPEYPGVAPRAEYHPGAGWLRSQGRDPTMVKGVEFTNIRIFEAEVKRMPNFALHELAHAYHDRELSGGFANSDVATAFIRAKESGKYAKVERHHGNDRPNSHEKAYALTSPMEYFAETSEAYFSRNDFFPFTRDELKTYDPVMYDLLGQLWQVPAPPAAPTPPAVPAAPPTLGQKLMEESPLELARAAREHGNAGRGAILFYQPSLACAKCHDAQTGTRIGPDLALVGKDATADYLIESLLAPSRVIKKGYETVTVTTADGRTITGLLAEEQTSALTLIDPAGGTRTVIATVDIESRSAGKQSIMPDGLVNLLSDRQQFLDLAKYVLDVAEGGPDRARDLRPAQTVFDLPDYENDIDHAGLIRSLDAKAYQRGEEIYTRVCANCHGTHDRPGSLPTSPRFTTHVFKNGGDPHSLYRTLTHGYNLMAPQTWMVPRQKYDVIHYLREAYLRPHNTTQYTTPNDAYLAQLPKGTGVGPAPARVDAWAAMDYGPSLINTYQVSGDGPNIAYKGIAVRLDPGSGGISRGRSWAVFDHDTLRYAAGWTGTGFIDWKGIHFNGQHQVHPNVVGVRHVENPVGPGWADPETGTFRDPRPRGRDGRPYGPLPRKWARFQGTYAYSDRTVIAYTVGDAQILELEGAEPGPGGTGTVFTRTLEIGASSRDLVARLAPVESAAAVVGDTRVTLSVQGGFRVLRVPAAATPTLVKVLLAKRPADTLVAAEKATPAPRPLRPLTVGGPKRWPEVLKTAATHGTNDGPFAADALGTPDRNPWNAQLRLTGFDFFPDGNRMAVCTWDGDVWIVTGINRPQFGLTWQRIASGLFQPLGLKFRDREIFVCCRDQIVRLQDLNGDGETDFYECFNTDHQVTEHFHEFAMGLQTDAAGNFYYAKSGRHALPAVVPHHGTLLKVSRDGTRTEILATGFRAANGVCLNPDGSFFVTDQEGFWTPKNRINKVVPGGFYGNMWGYTDVTDASDEAMEQPLCWVTNSIDRSPAEMAWVPAKTWGPLAGSVLNTSYGTGKVYVVPHETVNGTTQGGVCALPLPAFPTGIMRPRFHPTDGHLYLCGMYAWAGNQTAPGGLYRVRYTGKPIDLPIGLAAKRGGLEITFTDEIDRGSVDTASFDLRVWDLIRSRNYGSKHLNEKPLPVAAATLLPGGKMVRLALPGLTPTRGMEIRYRLRGIDGRTVTGTIHNTIHTTGQ